MVRIRGNASIIFVGQASGVFYAKLVALLVSFGFLEKAMHYKKSSFFSLWCFFFPINSCWNIYIIGPEGYVLVLGMPLGVRYVSAGFGPDVLRAGQ